MDGYLPDAACGGQAFFGAAKIECVADAEAVQHVGIGGREMAEVVRPEDFSPVNRSAVFSDIAAEVAEIAGAGEIEVAGG